MWSEWNPAFSAVDTRSPTSPACSVHTHTLGETHSTPHIQPETPQLYPGSGACLLPARSVPLPRPDLVDFSKLTKSNANYNLQRAFRTAEQHLGLTRLLDPEGEPRTAPAGLPPGATRDPSASLNSTPSCCNTDPNPSPFKSRLRPAPPLLHL